MEILTIHFFCTRDSVRNEVPLEEATLAVCTTDACGLALPVDVDRFPADAKKGDEFIYILGEKDTPLERLIVTHPDCLH